MSSNDLLLDVLKQFAKTLAGRFDVTEVLYELSDHATSLFSAAAAGVSLADDDGELRFVSANTEGAIHVERTQQKHSQGPCYDAFRSGSPVLVDDLTTRTEWASYRVAAAAVGIVAVAGIPLQLSDRIIGALNVYDDKVRRWSPDEIDAASVLADIATSFVAHSSELQQAQRVNAQLQQALDSRVLIEQAKGVLSGELGIPLDKSFQLLRQHARRNQASLREVAGAVVNLGLRPDRHG